MPIDNVESLQPKRIAQYPVISFTDGDFEGINKNLNDPMVISIIAANFLVKKVLVDQGSSANLLCLSTLRKMGIPKKHLRPFHRNLISFSRE